MQKTQYDDTGLNAVRLKCENGAILQSAEGAYGNLWVNVADLAIDFMRSLKVDIQWWECEPGDWVVGYRIFGANDNGRYDDYGALGVQVKCSGVDGNSYYLGRYAIADGQVLAGEGPPETQWSVSNWAQCAPGLHACGFRTKVEPPQGGSFMSEANWISEFRPPLGNDDEALTNLGMKCCPSPTFTKFGNLNVRADRQQTRVVEVKVFSRFCRNRQGGSLAMGPCWPKVCEAKCGQDQDCWGFSFGRHRNVLACYVFYQRGVSKENYLAYILDKKANAMWDFYLKD